MNATSPAGARSALPLHDVDVVALDLDGTLVDSAPDLARAVNRALLELGAPAVAEARLLAMIGTGIDALVTAALTASLLRVPSPSEVNRCRALVLTQYAACTVERSVAYPGVPAALAMLRDAGLMLCCVTNKFARLSLPLLRALDLERWFDCVLCAEHPWQRKPAPILLDEVCRRTATPPSRVLMVGDTRDDIAAARAAGCRVAAVTYGYNAPPTLADAAPDWMLDSLQALAALDTRTSPRAHTTQR